MLKTNFLTRQLNKNRSFWQLIALYAGILVVTYLMFSIYKPLYGFIRNGVLAQTVTALFVFIGVFCLAFLAIEKKLTTKRVIIILFVIAVCVRIGYMLITPASVRQYDTYTEYCNGHEAYAWTIFLNFKLPINNDYQFYHPPLNAFLQAVFMRVVDLISLIWTKLFGIGDFYHKYADSGFPLFLGSDFRRYYLFSSCQILSVLYSVMTMVVGYKIFKEMGIKGVSLVFCFAFFAFFPRHIVFSASLNNDALSYLLSLLALYFAIKWWKDKTLKNILLIALFVGLGMMTKLSSATICLPIAVIFIIEFIKTLKHNKTALRIDNMVLQYASFLLLSVPLGLWFQLYAFIRFDQPFGYVWPYLAGELSTAHASIFERFVFTFDLKEYFHSLYVRNFYNADTGIYGNYNIWNILIRSVIFGEFGYWQGEGFAISAMIFELLIIFILFVCSIIAAVYYFKDRSDKKSIISCDDINSKAVVILVTLVISQMIPYIAFNLKMPYSCTADFRYIMPMILAVVLLSALICKKLSQKGVFLKRVTIALQLIITLFISSSTLFYLTCI